jgi:hypothetical protein
MVLLGDPLFKTGGWRWRCSGGTIAVVDIPFSHQAISLTFSANERFLKYKVVILLGIL